MDEEYRARSRSRRHPFRPTFEPPTLFGEANPLSKSYSPLPCSVVDRSVALRRAAALKPTAMHDPSSSSQRYLSYARMYSSLARPYVLPGTPHGGYRLSTQQPESALRNLTVGLRVFGMRTTTSSSPGLSEQPKIAPASHSLSPSSSPRSVRSILFAATPRAR